MALSKIQAESMNLADTYTFTGTVSGASNLVLLEEDTTGASDVAYADVTLSQSSDYDHQILVVNGFYHNDTSTGRDMSWFMIEGGSRINSTGAYSNSRIGKKNGVSTNGSSDQSSTQIRLQWYAIGNAANEPSDIYIKIFNSHSTSLRTTLHAEINGISDDGNNYTNYANSIRLATTVCEGLRMQASVGNLTYAQYRLFGVKA